MRQNISYEAVRGMSLRKVILLGISNGLKISEAIKPLQLDGQAAEFKFESKFEPLPVIWQSLRRLFQKTIEGLEGKINGQALGAALWLFLRWSDWREQTQGISKLATAATGSLEENMLPLLLY